MKTSLCLLLYLTRAIDGFAPRSRIIAPPRESPLRRTSPLSVLPPELTDLLLSTTVAANQAGAASIEVLGHDIFIFLAASVVVVPLSRALNVTPVLGFLALGCLIGPYGIELFQNSEADLELGDFGILFLLFNEGLALSPSRIRKLTSFGKMGLGQLLLSINLFFFGTILGGPFVLQIADQMGFPLDDTLLRPILSSPVQAFCIASAGALSSSAFVLPVLKAKEWEDKPEGIASLSILLLQDLAVAPLLVILPLLAGLGPQTSTELAVLVAKATFGFGAVLALGSVILNYVFEIVAAARSTETFVAAALLVAVGMGQLADWLGLSATTGAFAAGVLLAGNRYRPQIQADIKPFEGILLGIFFLTAGANLDPTLVLEEWPTLLTGVVAFIATKTAILLLEGPSLGLTPGQATRVALTLSGGGEFALVLFKLAEDLGVLPGQLGKLLTASVIISMALTPLLAELGDLIGNYLDANLGSSSGDEMDGLMSSAEAQALFDEIDVDKSGTIELDELRNVLVSRGVRYASIADIFITFDTDGNGAICRDEWEAGLRAGIFETSILRDALNTTDSTIQFDSDAVVLAGFGELGQATFKMLKASGCKVGSVMAVDLNPSRVTAGVLSGAPVVFGDGANINLLRAAGVNRPKAVILNFVSEARTLDAAMRLRETLPEGTPIYARADNCRIRKELLDAGATDVVSEIAETVLRYGDLLNLYDSSNENDRLRKTVLDDLTERETCVGLSDAYLTDLAVKAGMSLQDLSKLYDVFSSLLEDGKDDVPITELRDFMMRLAGDGPIDAAALTRCMENVDEDGGGRLTFDEFVRTTCLPSIDQR
jgi:Kef-type K+ transport system membrane component KefB/Ca2+-binding EF-hand superfamily protein/voltage-gated potassium channel Kch